MGITTGGSMLKTHNCGDITIDLAGSDGAPGEKVDLAGWVHRRRDHGGLIFIDLRDRSGIVQVVFRSDENATAYAVASTVRSEFVLRITGNVIARSKDTVNEDIATGEIEVLATDIDILNPSKTPPFSINEDIDVDESIRLQYRYIDLRRSEMQHTLALRHDMNLHIRNFMSSNGFLEIETPMMIAATPEGARDYLVPSRLHPGSFYALPQSPQQLKQILMVGGFERYFQIARCMRDEDLRADRQPEFTQLDLEMSFCDESDVLGLVEELLTGLVTTLRPDILLPRPFECISYAESMERFGTDKPDLRYGVELTDCSDLVQQSDFAVFRKVLEANGRVRAVVMPGGATLSRKQVDEFTTLAKTMGGKGLVALQFNKEPDLAEEEDIRSPVLQHLGLDVAKSIGIKCEAKTGDLVLLAADSDFVVNTVLDGTRREIARRLSLADPMVFHFAFITEFPLFEHGERDGEWSAIHHPFTSPMSEDLELMKNNPSLVRSRAYDAVANGFELGSGSIRIHQRDIQEQVFEVLGINSEQAQLRFGHLLQAFEYGAPPHGGFAIGLDRVAMLLADSENIREVIAFPKTQSAADPLTGAPTPVGSQQLDELGLSLLNPPQES